MGTGNLFLTKIILESFLSKWRIILTTYKTVSSPPPQSWHSAALAAVLQAKGYLQMWGGCLGTLLSWLQKGGDIRAQSPRLCQTLVPTALDGPQQAAQPWPRCLDCRTQLF